MHSNFKFKLELYARLQLASEIEHQIQTRHQNVKPWRYRHRKIVAAAARNELTLN